MNGTEFDGVLGRLRDWRNEIVERLREGEGREGALDAKRGIDAAIGCLELCLKYGIRGKSRVVVLPMMNTRSPSSEYRVIEDHETDNRDAWTEVLVNRTPVRPCEGAIIVEPAVQEETG